MYSLFRVQGCSGPSKLWRDAIVPAGHMACATRNVWLMGYCCIIITSVICAANSALFVFKV